MAVQIYQQYGKSVGYRVAIKRNSVLVHQAYFPFSKYKSKGAALKAAEEDNKAAQSKYALREIDRIITPDGYIYGLLLSLDKRGNPSLRVQSTFNKKRLNRQKSLLLYDWEEAFEELVSTLLTHLKIALDFEIAMAIEAAKKKYDPSRKSNWKGRAKKPRPTLNDKAILKS